MRRFGTQGRVYPNKHYFVSRTDEIADFIDRIKDGRYIVLFAPQQTGRTTFFRWALEALTTQDTTYFPIQLDFEGYEEYAAVDFYISLYTEIQKEIRSVFQTRKEVISSTFVQFLASTKITDHVSMGDFFDELAKHLVTQYNNPQRVLLFIDSFHGIPPALENGFLAMLRHIYLTDRPRCPHSVCFVSVRNIIQRDMINVVSPFNIQDEFNLSNFTLGQVHELLTQYTEEVGQVFEAEVVEALYKQTAGQPFLVNRLAQILTEELGIPKKDSITIGHFSDAHTRILQEHNANFENLITCIHRDPRFEGILMRIISHSKKGVFFDRYDERIAELAINGIISEGNYGMCQIANPIYFDYIRRVFNTQFKEFEQESFS